VNTGSFNSSKKLILTHFVVVVICLYFLSLREVSVRRVSIFETWLIEAFAPLQEGTTLFKGKAISLFDDYLLLINASKENRLLKSEVENLKDEIFHLEEIEKENARLKKLLKFGEEIKMDKIMAQIIAKDASAQIHLLRINKGANDGIKLKAPVVTSQGLVGYIFHVSPNYSDILTVLNPNNRVDVIVDRTRTHGILEGNRGNSCRIKYIAKTEPIEKEDLVITAGLGTIYPKGIKVGKISVIEKESYGITQYIEVTPVVDFHRLEEVMVLLGTEEKQTK